MSSRLDVATLAVGRVLQSVILFLTYRELTHLLSKSEVGLYFFLLAITGGIGLIVVNPAGTFFNRFLHKWQKDQALSNNLLLFAGFTLVAATLACGVTLAAQHFTQQGTEITAIAVALFVFGSTLSNTFLPALNLLHFPRRFVFLTVACQALTLIAAVTAARIRPDASVWLATTGLVNLVFGVVGFLSLLKISKPPAAVAPARPQEYWSFAWPLMLANVGIWFLTQGYRPVAQHLFGLEALAVIGLGLGLASSIGNAFETLAQQLFLPKFYENSHHAEVAARRKSWDAVWSRLVPMYFSIAVFVTGFSAALVRVLAPTSYADAWIYLSIGAWIEFFRMSSGLISLLTFSEMKTKSTIRPFLEGALLTFGLMLTFHWIAVSILIGNIYAFIRIAASLKLSGSLLKLAPGAAKLIVVSLLFLLPIFFRSVFDSLWVALTVLALAGVGLCLALWRNGAWNREAR